MLGAGVLRVLRGLGIRARSAAESEHVDGEERKRRARSGAHVLQLLKASAPAPPP